MAGVTTRPDMVMDGAYCASHAINQVSFQAGIRRKTSRCKAVLWFTMKMMYNRIIAKNKTGVQ